MDYLRHGDKKDTLRCNNPFLIGSFFYIENILSLMFLVRVVHEKFVVEFIDTNPSRDNHVDDSLKYFLMAFSNIVWCLVGCGTLCTILKMWKTLMEDCYLLIVQSVLGKNVGWNDVFVFLHFLHIFACFWIMIKNNRSN